ncbi:uncharacterized protein LOC129243568 [Anastrepha obliqua]|uniref:uncharacterized protein LOC129243568 n=1 Tax=Anastrepha obliqua TaxID=95512 RepID=UPI0024098DA1|nr:uncharacterized protein LOC129243568 [Anastrepha obliqua]
MRAQNSVRLPVILLIFLLQTYHNLDLRADAAVTSSMSAEADIDTEHTDSYNIRHGRSKVRRSNEKEHNLWVMRPQNTPTTNKVANRRNVEAAASTGVSKGVRKDSAIVSQNFKVESSLVGAVSAIDYVDEMAPNTAEGNNQNLTMHKNNDKMYKVKEQNDRLSGFWSSEPVSSIQTGNGHLFGSDYWRNSDANGTLISPPEISSPQRLRMLSQSMPQYRTQSVGERNSQRADKQNWASAAHPFRAAKATALPETGINGLGTTDAPVTHRIRKLHMKKIMESIRNNVDKSLGVKLTKNHQRSLVTAEQLQGRPMDVALNHAHDTATDDNAFDSADNSMEEGVSQEDSGSPQ